jgi:hypothetical protein
VRSAAALGKLFGSGVINKNASHGLRRDAEKMGPVLELFVLIPDHFDESFIDEPGGLKRVTGILAGHVAMRYLAQLLVDQWHQAVECIPVSFAPVYQQLSYLVGRCGHCRHLLCCTQKPHCGDLWIIAPINSMPKIFIRQ